MNKTASNAKHMQQYTFIISSVVASIFSSSSLIVSRCCANCVCMALTQPQTISMFYTIITMTTAQMRTVLTADSDFNDTFDK